MRNKHRFTIPLILALLVTMLLPATASAVTYTSYENYTTGDDTDAEIYGAIWFAQTFTTNATLPGTSHTVNTIRLKLLKEGVPGTLTAGIRATNSSGAPTGLDLCSGTYDGTLFTSVAGGNWYDITVDEITLDVNTTYAIVCRGTGTLSTANIHWRYDTAGATYTGGHEWASTTGGAIWTADTDEDYMFNVFGSPAMEVIGANVYEGYINDGDWLIVAKAKNIFEPYYGDDTSKGSFYLQFTKADDTLIAQTPLPAWGYKPASLYLSNSTVAALEWGAGYKVKMSSIASPYYNTTYTLTADDWRGSNLVMLDGWCLATAHAMETFYSETFVMATAVKGDVLNEEGGAMFVIGIPYLSSVRPGIFEVALADVDYTTPTWTGAYEDSLPEWDAAIGGELAAIITDAGSLVNLSGKEMGTMLIVIAYVAIATFAFSAGHGTAGMALALPVLILGVYWRFIPFAAMGVMIAITVVLMVRQIWWANT